MKTRKQSVKIVSQDDSNRLALSAAQAERCLYSTSDTRRCTMLRAPSHASLCPFHASQERQLLESDRVGADLATLSGEFKTGSDVNHALGKLFAVLAQNRIPARNAAVLAYIGQLLLQSLSTVKHEIQSKQGHSAWEQTVSRALLGLPPDA